MKRKFNPKEALVALLLLASIISFVCDGCAVETDATVVKNMERFTVEYAGSECYIITDNVTSVQYLMYCEMSNYGRGVGLTRLEVK